MLLHLALHVQYLSLLLCCSVPGTALRYEHPNSALYTEVWETPLKVLPALQVSHNKGCFLSGNLSSVRRTFVNNKKQK